MAAPRRARPRPEAIHGGRLPSARLSQLLPAFGDLNVEAITTPMIESWFAGLGRRPSARQKALVLLHGIFQRARKLYGPPSNPVADVEKPSIPRSGDIDGFSPEEVMALVRAARSEQDAASS